MSVARLGAKVPPFELEAYLPESQDFGTVSSSTLQGEKKWIILFFYPADFTFV